MTIKRTTVAAEADDLMVLDGEARRRGISLASVLREAVATEAARLRGGAQPRFGIARSGVGAARVAAKDESAPMRDRRHT